MRRKTAPGLLAESLLELAQHKNIDKITIREIVNNCHLSSQTFYNHFSDKYALILWIHHSKGVELLQKFESGEITFRQLTEENLRFYKEHANFMVNALLNTHGTDSYWFQSAENAISLFETYIKEHFDPDGFTQEQQIHLRMFVYGCTEIFAYWATQMQEISVEVMADHICNAIPASIREYF